MLSIKEIEIKYNIIFYELLLKNYSKEISNIFNDNIKEYENNKDPNILFIMGCYHLYISKNYPEMKKYYLMAIEHNNSTAMNNLAQYHEHISKNYPEMEKYYLMAIKHNNSTAMYNLAQYHDDISKNYPEMEKYYLMAIQLNHSNAMNNLGYYYGKITKNYPEMEKYYLMAIEHNNSNAMNNLGYYHEKITKNYPEMEKYYLMAIKHNNSYAMYCLINYYFKNNKKLLFVLNLDIDLKFNIEKDLKEKDLKKKILNSFNIIDKRFEKLCDKVINKEEFKINKPDFSLIFHFENSVEIYKIHSIFLNYRYFEILLGDGDFEGKDEVNIYLSNKKTINLFIKYLYTNNFEHENISEEVIDELLFLGKQYCMDNLIILCTLIKIL